jgi:hypothetical protein
MIQHFAECKQQAAVSVLSYPDTLDKQQYPGIRVVQLAGILDIEGWGFCVPGFCPAAHNAEAVNETV